MVNMDTSEQQEQQQQEEEDVERLVHCELNTTLYFGERNRGKGTLFVRESDLVWKASHDIDDKLTLKYPSISLHAISRDTSNFPHECLYVLLESPQVISEEERDPEADVCEVRFVPDNENNIKAMYDAVTQCQELHPDADDMQDSDDGDAGYVDDDEPAPTDFDTLLAGGEFYTADNMPDEIELSDEGRAVLQRLNIVCTTNDTGANGNGHNDQFDDADENMDAS